VCRITKILLYFFLINSAFVINAQNETTVKLAAQYFQEREFLKASELYAALYEQKPGQFYYQQYMQCLLELNDLKTAEKFLKKELKSNSQDARMNVDLGFIYQSSGDDSKANKHYQSIINDIKADRNQINNTANAFIIRGLYSRALETYIKGRALLKGQYRFGFEIANIYFIQSRFAEMTEEYLDLLDENQQAYVNAVQQRLQDFITRDSDDTRAAVVRTALLTRINKNPDRTYYSEMLLWLFIQQKDFSAALIQAKSIDRRLSEDGGRIMNLARISAANKDYDVAIEAYEYIIAKGESIYYFDARIELINSRYAKITEGITYTRKELLDLQRDYNVAINEIGKNSNTIPLIKNLARLEAFYLNNDSLAKALLEEAIAFRDAKPLDRAECKIELADIYLVSGDVWEATLLYSQVEKDKVFKNEPIGHLAKFKNAKLSYYIGEFDWAKAQLDVLKAATSKLIANDAMELSLLISDNIDPVDSSTIALEMFARADLLAYRKRVDLALLTLDSLQRIFSFHPIADDVIFKKAKIMLDLQRYDVADSLFELVVKKFEFDILADDALFHRAIIYEEIKYDKDKAMELYQDLLTRFPGSLYNVEARRRFRILRGDNIN